MPNPSKPQEAEEEKKVDMDELRYMYGTLEEFVADFWSRLEGVNLNEL